MKTHNFKKDIDYRLFYGLIIIMVLLLTTIVNDTYGLGPCSSMPCDHPEYDFHGHFIGCFGCEGDCSICNKCVLGANGPQCKQKYDDTHQSCCDCIRICEWNDCKDCAYDGTGNCRSICDPSKCQTCDGHMNCPVCGGDPNKACCNGECYDKRIKQCCQDTANGYICDINCKSCCNGSCCNSTNCEICKNNTCVVAHPTNMQQIKVEDMGNGTLHFEYTWGSTTGDPADLYNCGVRENVVYPGSSPFCWVSPPWANVCWQNPTIWPDPPIPAIYQGLQDDHYPPGFVKPYCNDEVDATQVYQYNCGFCTDWDTLKDIGSISRYITGDGNLWRYSITKSGAYAEIFPLQ